MNEKYEISIWMDNIYAVYDKVNDPYHADYVFKGTLEEINAWMSLQEKGFII